MAPALIVHAVYYKRSAYTSKMVLFLDVFVRIIQFILSNIPLVKDTMRSAITLLNEHRSKSRLEWQGSKFCGMLFCRNKLSLLMKPIQIWLV